MRTSGRTLGIIIGLTVVIFSLATLAGCGGSTTTTTIRKATTTTAPEVTTTDPPSTTTLTSPESVEVGSLQKDAVPMGKQVLVGGWNVTVLSATLNATEAVASFNEFNQPPAVGSQYVIVKVQATRTGGETAAFSDDTFYSFVGNKGAAFEAVPVAVLESMGDTEPVATGAVVTGSIVFEVASDQVESGLLMLQSGASMDDAPAYFALK
jgi:hypothetical protein